MPVSIPGIEIVKVVSPGEYDKERVILRMKETVDLISYVVLNAKSSSPEEVFDLNNRVFWFPSIVANQGDYVRLWSGMGKYSLTTGKWGDKPARFHNFYWQLDEAVWKNESNTVVVMRLADWIHKRVLPGEGGTRFILKD